jgi:hypothetical protein
VPMAAALLRWNDLTELVLNQFQSVACAIRSGSEGSALVEEPTSSHRIGFSSSPGDPR